MKSVRQILIDAGVQSEDMPQTIKAWDIMPVAEPERSIPISMLRDFIEKNHIYANYSGIQYLYVADLDRLLWDYERDTYGDVSE